MAKTSHEIRDPIHVFVRLDSDDRRVLDSRPFQRLRNINQLALSHLVYPGATHKRFEHSLGVMELAGRVYDVLTDRRNLTSHGVTDHFPELEREDELRYWRRALRMAALCHDIGHMPFSHTAEQLLPEGWTHERMTAEIIDSAEMQQIWSAMIPPLRSEHIIKLAVGPKDAAELDISEFNDWETLLSEIIVGDAFGVDRMDYLLRDSYHAGVTYGKFDHHRLVDTLRILPASGTDTEGQGEAEQFELGVEHGGLHSAEALLLARFFMFMQVYCHPVRRIYDIHLRDFLQEWLQDGTFSTDVNDHIAMTDVEVMNALRKARSGDIDRGTKHAQRILNRGHFKVLYNRNPDDVEMNPDAVTCIFEAARDEFGPENVRADQYVQSGGAPDFPVLDRDGRIVTALSKSQTLETLPVVATGYVFMNRDCIDEAERWLDDTRDQILRERQEQEEGDT